MRLRLYGFALICLLCMGLMLSFALAEDATPTPEPRVTPSVGTPSPDALVAPTRTPPGWFQAGEIGFNIKEMTVEDRTRLINELHNANLYDQVQEVPVVQGTLTSRDEPVYVGQRAQFPQVITFEMRDDHRQEGTVTMTLQEVIRGEEASRLVIEMNALNKLPDPGKEYIISVFDIGVTSEDVNEMFMFTMYDFQPINVAGRVLDYAYITDEDGGLLQLYSGGNGTLRVTALVSEGTDFIYLRYRETVWFSTKVLDESE